jgi:hypothetical protein
MNKNCGDCKHLNRDLAFCRACGAKWLKETNGANCKYFEEITPPTNGDKIRQMSNEELVDALIDICHKFFVMSHEAVLSYLNAPAESEEGK